MDSSGSVEGMVKGELGDRVKYVRASPYCSLFHSREGEMLSDVSMNNQHIKDMLLLKIIDRATIDE